MHPSFLTGSFYGFHVLFYAIESLSSSALPQNLLGILVASVLNSASIILLVSILFSSFFLEFSSVLSFGPCFFVSSFWQAPCVCFYVLGRPTTSPKVAREA